MKNFLDEILASKRKEMQAARQKLPLDDLISLAKKTPRPRSFVDSLKNGASPRIIAEIKRRSPSKGDINPGLDAPRVARLYEAGGVAAISVLTDAPYFGGSLEDLADVREAVALPLIRKDFIIGPYQVWEARLHGADAVLLIVAALNDKELESLNAVAEDAGLDALVEAHTEDELKRAIAVGAKLIGLNSRDLRTFNVDRELAIRLKPSIPDAVTVVVESGIKSRDDIGRYMSLGYRAFLIGEALAGAPDIAKAVKELCR